MPNHDHDHGDAESHAPHERRHGHTHGAVDPTLVTTARGIWAVKWSFVGLAVTALFQVVVVLYSGSVALLADTIHNFGDAATAIPLAIAFLLARRKPSRRFTYGYGRMEDLAGVAVVATIFASAVVAAWQSIERLFHPQEVGHLWAVAAAAIVGFAGNELVARFRIGVGREIGSAALVADGYHARVDGLTSLAVLASAAGIRLGLPLADPLIGILITLTILRIVWQSAKSVFTRLLDGVDPEVVDEIEHSARHVAGVLDITHVRVRWLGHRLHAELNIAVVAAMSVADAHKLALDVRHELLHHLQYLSDATIHVDPAGLSGDEHHAVPEHSHDGAPLHSHP